MNNIISLPQSILIHNRMQIYLKDISGQAKCFQILKEEKCKINEVRKNFYDTLLVFIFQLDLDPHDEIIYN